MRDWEELIDVVRDNVGGNQAQLYRQVQSGVNVHPSTLCVAGSPTTRLRRVGPLSPTVLRTAQVSYSALLVQHRYVLDRSNLQVTGRHRDLT